MDMPSNEPEYRVGQKPNGQWEAQTKPKSFSSAYWEPVQTRYDVYTDSNQARAACEAHYKAWFNTLHPQSWVTVSAKIE